MRSSRVRVRLRNLVSDRRSEARGRRPGRLELHCTVFDSTEAQRHDVELGGDLGVDHIAVAAAPRREGDIDAGRRHIEGHGGRRGLGRSACIRGGVLGVAEGSLQTVRGGGGLRGGTGLQK